MYDYKAKVVGVVDGDTIDIEIDLGFDIKIKQRVRLYGVDTPETHGETKEKGLESKKFVEKLLPINTEVLVKTVKTNEKYGRFLASILMGDIDVSKELVKNGLAVEYYGGKKGEVV